jgi:putative PIN family toxin of toxin-antitoxin system
VLNPRVILDSSTVVSAIGWRGEARKVLHLLALGAFQSCRTPFLTTEWVEVVQRVATDEPRWKNRNWENWLLWLKTISKLAEDIPARPTSRDPNDDPVIMAAVSARAAWIVTKDPDLLCLGKPYGVTCATPRAFLSAMLKQD